MFIFKFSLITLCFSFYGCGLPIPEALDGCKVLDLGSGAGRDCYILSKLVGKNGHVVGLDMTEEMASFEKFCYNFVSARKS